MCVQFLLHKETDDTKFFISFLFTIFLLSCKLLTRERTRPRKEFAFFAHSLDQRRCENQMQETLSTYFISFFPSSASQYIIHSICPIQLMLLLFWASFVPRYSQYFLPSLIFFCILIIFILFPLLISLSGQIPP